MRDPQPTALMPNRRQLLTGAAVGAGLLLQAGTAAPMAQAAALRGRVYTISQRNTVTSPTCPRTEFRGLWVASVLNVDWPSKPGLPVATQQAELRAWLDLAVKRRLNAVLLQVRPAADRMWVSTLGEPWSAYLTGTQGQDPGYDPLAYAIAEAHRRALALHAWINPYRVSMSTSLSSLVASHPARRNPSWSFAYGGKRYYNPGIPAVRTYIGNVVADLVKRYDVDGIHFDDYFYPYPVSGAQIPDAAAWKKYRGSYTSLSSWRRHNVNLFIKEADAAIHRVRPRTVFGIAPFGIWRNSSSSSLGSATNGLESYSALYADSRYWVKQGWVDYIAPQLYWPQGYTPADYNVLIAWWARAVAGTGVRLFTGEAAYKVGSPTPAGWLDKNELRDHLTLGRAISGVNGQVYYNAASVRANQLNAFGILAARHYARPALPVPLPGLKGTRPYTPVITSARRESRGIRLRWDSSGSGEAIDSIAIWRWDSTGSVLPYIQSTATYLRAVVRRTTRSQSWLDTGVAAGISYWYMIQAISRTGIDSSRATAVFVRA
ncbi:glycoside hydrolase family 10 protein [Paeniglutamicibacter cryotolerans]|uniref:Uncharacterized lipoprotein YddW (UPF0748 family) n=1 Tax=Paeniglutamicibacter cryotolerans TaxID=670079 RepID=A0A839QP68_9MICC|nr:family 10 glycosylhydrolase [Paeniglutamicibacter cryotolerans]MBB2993871.1 uncharacterized lipoprotein YddW (UPF0748 family) [Paeniglutamicibacter cryotolerans]